MPRSFLSPLASLLHPKATRLSFKVCRGAQGPLCHPPPWLPGGFLPEVTRKNGQAGGRRHVPEQGLHGPGVGTVVWTSQHCPASQLSICTVPTAAQCVIQDPKTCLRLGQPWTQGLYVGKSALQEPAWLPRSILLSSGTGHTVSATSPAKQGLTRLAGTFWVPVCPCQAVAKHFPAGCGHTDRRQGLCPSPAFLSTPRVFSCCPHRFAGQVLLGMGPGSLLQRKVHLGPGNWKRVFFINNKLTVIVISTPRPGKVPSHAGLCNRRAPSCAQRKERLAPGPGEQTWSGSARGRSQNAFPWLSPPCKAAAAEPDFVPALAQ